MIVVFSFGSSFINRKNNNPKISTYCLLILMWLPVSIWLAIVHIILLVLDTIARRSLKVNFNADNIEYPSFPKRNIQWDELANVILKDGLLTMDFKNNKLIQDEIKISEQVNETAFNRYCEQQLKA
ncbi:MAG TPA: hypothetical protein VK809_08420 [Bacteroidia bacterium]|jgi:hypothetical protein|nr:hypothetical protein [Bacteroidia bacterium]